MEVKIKNIKLADCINLLDKLPLKNKKSRHRTTLSVLLSKRLQEVAEEEKLIRKEHCNLDDEGEPKVKKDGRLDIKDVNSLKKDLSEFHEEEYVIEGGNAQGFLKTVKGVLVDANTDWEGDEAYTYHYLCEAFDVDDENNKEDEEE